MARLTSPVPSGPPAGHDSLVGLAAPARPCADEDLFRLGDVVGPDGLSHRGAGGLGCRVRRHHQEREEVLVAPGDQSGAPPTGNESMRTTRSSTTIRVESPCQAATARRGSAPEGRGRAGRRGDVPRVPSAPLRPSTHGEETGEHAEAPGGGEGTPQGHGHHRNERRTVPARPSRAMGSGAVRRAVCGASTPAPSPPAPSPPAPALGNRAATAASPCSAARADCSASPMS